MDADEKGGSGKIKMNHRSSRSARDEEPIIHDQQHYSINNDEGGGGGGDFDDVPLLEGKDL